MFSGMTWEALSRNTFTPVVGYDEDIKRQVEIALTLAGRDLLGNPDLSWADVQDVITWDQILAYLEDLDRRVSTLEQQATSPRQGGSPLTAPAPRGRGRSAKRGRGGGDQSLR